MAARLNDLVRAKPSDPINSVNNNIVFALTDDIRLSKEKRKLRAARGRVSLRQLLRTQLHLTRPSTKSHASGKFKNPYFRILRIGSGVFFDADSESPHMT